MDKLIPLWVRHLAAHATGLELSAFLIGADGLIELPNPGTKDEALSHLTAIVDAWAVGLSAPLPVAPKTAFASLSNSKTPEARLNKMRKAYEGTKDFEGEMDRSPYFRRTFPSYEALMEGSVHHLGFEDWVDRLYRPLHEAFHSREGAA